MASDQTAPTRACVGITLLQSLDPSPSLLVRFIERNWLVMDRIAREQGLMTDYAVYWTESPNQEHGASWNVLVEVGYPDPRGYQAIAEQFERIRTAHVVELIEGMDLRSLGVVVRSLEMQIGARSP